ncbi:MAG: nicotinate-nucleotide diphosphorylase (carboxylating) [Arenimonas sp. SCN 70-307]|uniref:carboxylating nicotinate-nucleotide diphosphorylase n=1 Tax=Arenimonas sp. SCN 70-307 TaxID=1660089 RepID=UPI00086D42AE|nr:carboxylating nicotinate-nucleotide diphosphorylase [Arenimonas sp. SCN 70-307]ODS63510.1 MAG: nicotinate-nucleotide diphosphorylase (carboxylating) [Arenimonas sp. SCN 70-307]
MALPPSPPAPEVVAGDVARALAEDLGPGDATADLLPDGPAQAYVIAKEAGVVAGRPWFDACFRRLDPEVRIDWRVAEGQAVAAGTVLVTLAGRARALVSAERPALNFLQTLSATASRTAECVAALAGSRTRVLDTRKTLPGLRQAQKYAVRAGGGLNHRMGLYDAVMLKENHIHAAGSIAAAVAAARRLHPALPLIIEVETLDELDQALAAGCDRILVDEFCDADLREAVRRAAGRIPLEVSGGVTLGRLAALGEIGVDYVSIGALTKHVQALDLSLRLGPPPA